MRRRPRIPPLLASVAILAALGGVLALADDTGRGEPGEDEAAPPPHEVAGAAEIAARLERIRQLEFDEVPEVQMLSREEWRERAAQLGERGRADPAARRESEAIGDLLRLGGLAPPDFEVDDVASGIGELVGGFYRPRSNRLVLVEQPLQGTRGTEAVTAHELEHALQDQNYPDVLKLNAVSGERGVALSALVEGDASVVERRYKRRHLDLPTADVDKSLLSPANLAVGLPPALVASVRFPYTAGAEFVAALERRGGWELVDEAFEDPPTTSEQILHPGKWIDDEEGERVELDGASALGPGWRSVATVESGELDAIVILASGIPSDVAQRAARGWQGGAFETFRLGDAPCASVCRGSRAALLAYEWETPADAAEFAAAAARYLGARVSGPARIAIDGTRTAIAFAPSAGLADRLAATALPG